MSTARKKHRYLQENGQKADAKCNIDTFSANLDFAAASYDS